MLPAGIMVWCGLAPAPVVRPSTVRPSLNYLWNYLVLSLPVVCSSQYAQMIFEFQKKNHFLCNFLFFVKMGPIGAKIAKRYSFHKTMLILFSNLSWMFVSNILTKLLFRIFEILLSWTLIITIIIIIIIIICSSYIALFLAEASSKRFTYYYPWQTCSIRHLLNSPGSVHPLTHFKAPRVI